METRFGIFEDRTLRSTIYWTIVVLIVLVDQATKAAAREVLEEGPRVLIPGVINLVHVENTGAAFSLGQGAGVLLGVLAAAFVTLATITVWRASDLPRSLVIAIGMVSGGAFGNLIDRVVHGSVTDFISAAFVSFPVFNVADICITVGVVLLFIGLTVWEEHPEPAGEMDMGNV